MATRMSDTRMFAHLWTAPELSDVFDEPARLATWLRILQALARAQAGLGIIPADAAQTIGTVRAEDLDLDLVAEQTRAASHSTLGLIRGLQAVLPDGVDQWVYYGATVQDVSDTWFGMAMRDVANLVSSRLDAITRTVLDLAELHRDDVQLGRTHGQTGSAITFGYKAASWADELARHRQRLDEGRPRWAVGQLAGAVGVLGFFGGRGLDLRAAFCAELGLADPGISWTTSRDRIAEFASVLAMICSTLARIGNEVYELQRPEIGELCEPRSASGVSSITMPHKRNPESSEHLATLARLVRANAGLLLDGIEQQHERDGRGWKVEWLALPEVCELTVVALSTALSVVTGLDVDTEAMQRNVRAAGLSAYSEQLLVELSARLGKHRAQAMLQDLLAGGDDGDPIEERLANAVNAVASQDLSPAEVGEWLSCPRTGSAAAMVDVVLSRARGNWR
jgi:adenylosuccinate lyase